LHYHVQTRRGARPEAAETTHHDVSDPTPRATRPRLPWRELVALALYGIVLLAFRPLDPFEWDEVLFQRALDHYDVASHSPHPPGYPLYVAAGKAVRFVVRDPQLALQLVGVASALAALALTWLLARRLGAGRNAATLTAAALAVFPGFLFNANIGMSDVLGVAAGVGVALLFALAWERPALFAVAAAAAGGLSGVRIASLIVAMPPALVALAAAWRRRAWGWLALAPAAFAAAAAAVWVPAILVTGRARYFGAVQQQAEYIRTTWVRLRLPGAALDDIGRAWGLTWLGPRELAILLWVLVVTGAIAWWHTGKRRMVAMAAFAAAAFLLFAAFELEYDLAMRYALPAAPFLALLAAGVTTARRRWLRAAGGAALAAWAVATAAWVAPAFPLRLRPAPVWQAMTYVRATFDPAKTRIVFDGVMGPHFRYVLERAGFRGEALKGEALEASKHAAGPDVVFITPQPIEGAEVLFQADWGSRRLLRLARNRYGACTVCRKRPVPVAPEVSPEITEGPDSWTLAGAGWIRLPQGAKPMVMLLEARGRAIAVRVPGRPPATLEPGSPMPVTVFPGRAGQVELITGNRALVELAPIELLGLKPGGAAPGLAADLVVPQVARTLGAAGSRWRSNVVLYNPNAFAIEVTALFLPTGQANLEAAGSAVGLAPGELTEIADVVALRGLAGEIRSGALVLEGRAAAGDRGAAPLVATSRTFNTQASVPFGEPGEVLPAVPVGEGLCVGGRAIFRGVNGSGQRVNLGVVALADAPVRVRVVQYAAAGPGASEVWEIPPFGHLQRRLAGAMVEGSVEIEVAAGPASARVFAYLSQIDAASGKPLHSLPETTAACPPGSAPPPLPRRLPADAGPGR
jgi:hypothetical protein